MKDNLNLKIYGITKVWTKWQIIIPKDCREDFDIKSWDDFVLVMVDKKAFGIWKPRLQKQNFSKRLIEKIWDIQIWTKYQFVIPSNIRTEYWIKPKDTLLVIWKQKAKWEEWVWFIKNDNIEYFLDFIKDYIKN